MTLPTGAIFEDELAGGVALYDVTDVLPRNKKRKYKTRETSGIIRVYNHHSGALGKDGFQGAANSARYRVKDRTKKLPNGSTKLIRGWPGMPYTYWYCYEPDRDEDNRIVVYRCNADATRSYHTGKKANDHGVGNCWQGNLTVREPSNAQIEMAEAHFPWLMARHDLADDRPFSFHSEAGAFGGKKKPTCPGPHVTKWVSEYRDKLIVHPEAAPMVV